MSISGHFNYSYLSSLSNETFILTDNNTDNVDIPDQTKCLIAINFSPDVITQFLQNNKRKLINLRWIAIHQCGLKELPDIFLDKNKPLELQYLEGLDLRGNLISELENFSAWISKQNTPNLLYFNILDNPFSEILYKDTAFQKIFQLRQSLIQINKRQVTPFDFAEYDDEEQAILQTISAIRMIPEDSYYSSAMQTEITLSKEIINYPISYRMDSITSLDLSNCGLYIFPLNYFDNLRILFLNGNADLYKVIFKNNCHVNLLVLNIAGTKLNKKYFRGKTPNATILDTNLFMCNSEQTQKKAISFDAKEIDNNREIYECVNASQYEDKLFLEANVFHEIMSRVSFLVQSNNNEVSGILPILETGTFVDHNDAKKSTPQSSLSNHTKVEFVTTDDNLSDIDIIRKFMTEKCKMNLNNDLQIYHQLPDINNFVRYAPFNYNMQYLFIKKLVLVNVGANDDVFSEISSNCRNLMWLDLSRNEITCLKDLNKTVMSRLHYLNVSYNKIKNAEGLKRDPLDGIRYLKSLEHIVIEGNQLTNISFTDLFRKFRGLKKIDQNLSPFPLTPPEIFAVDTIRKQTEFDNVNSLDTITFFKSPTHTNTNLKTSVAILRDGFTCQKTNINEIVNCVDKPDLISELEFKTPQTDLAQFADLILIFMSLIEKLQYIRHFLPSINDKDYPGWIHGTIFTLYSFIMKVSLFLRSLRFELPLPNLFVFFFFGLAPIFMMWLMNHKFEMKNLVGIHRYRFLFTLIFGGSLLLIFWGYDVIFNGIQLQWKFLWWFVIVLIVCVIIFVCIGFFNSESMNSNRILQLTKYKEQICLAVIVLTQFPALEFMIRIRSCVDGYFSDFPSVDCNWPLFPAYAYFFFFFNTIVYFYFFVHSIQRIHSTYRYIDDGVEIHGYWRQILVASKKEIYKSWKYYGTIDNSIIQKHKKLFIDYCNFIRNHWSPSKFLCEGRIFASSWFLILEFAYKLVLFADDIFECKSILTFIASIFVLLMYSFIPPKANNFERISEIVFVSGTICTSMSAFIPHERTAGVFFYFSIVIWFISYFYIIFGYIVSLCENKCKRLSTYAERRWYTTDCS